MDQVKCKKKNIDSQKLPPKKSFFERKRTSLLLLLVVVMILKVLTNKTKIGSFFLQEKEKIGSALFTSLRISLVRHRKQLFWMFSDANVK
jgi:hypothetical protein